MNRDVRPSRLADQLGITEREARKLRRQVEFVEVSAPQRYEIVGRIEVKRCK